MLSLRAYAKHRKAKVYLAGHPPFGRPKSSCGCSDQVQKRQDRPEPGRRGLSSQLRSTATSQRGRRAWVVLSGADPARKTKADLAELDLAKRAAGPAVLFNATIWLRRQGFS